MALMGAHQHQQPSTLEGKSPRSWSQALHSSVWWEKMKLVERREVLTGDKEALFPMGQLSRAVGCPGRLC